jgi:hypothetical protein
MAFSIGMVISDSMSEGMRRKRGDDGHDGYFDSGLRRFGRLAYPMTPIMKIARISRNTILIVHIYLATQLPRAGIKRDTVKI